MEDIFLDRKMAGGLSTILIEPAVAAGKVCMASYFIGSLKESKEF
jgi:hypothetical protein